MQKMNLKWMAAVLMAAGMGLVGCRTVSMPAGLKPVKDFSIDRYAGTWYEIARLDHRFERDMVKVMATYTLRDDGRIGVLNRGFDAKRNVWKSADGVAEFAGDPRVGQLQVNFWGPFWGAYNIVALDADYQWAVVCGPDHSYFWILSRQPKMDKALLEKLVAKAREWGFNTGALIYPQRP